MPLGELKGRMTDLDDGTFIEFSLPERLSGAETIESENNPNSKLNAPNRFVILTGSSLEMSLVFIARTSEVLDVKTPVDWLRSRAKNKYHGGLIEKPPSRFSVSATAMVPKGSKWEFDSEVAWQTEGNAGANFDEMPPRVDVQFTLVRVDDGDTRSSYGGSFFGGL